MRIEAIDKHMCYRWPGGVVQLEPGKPIELPDARARRLLDRAPGRVRIVAELALVTVGTVVTWESPLFGLLSGPVLEVFNTSVAVLHPLTGVPCTIPKGWVR
jgi:hypothetical protein